MDGNKSPIEIDSDNKKPIYTLIHIILHFIKKTYQIGVGINI